MANTNEQFDKILACCRDIFSKKLDDYGAAWRIMRTVSITDQIFIKANRIRSIETIGEHKINEGIVSEFIGIVNYGIIGLIQLEKHHSDTIDIDKNEALRLFDFYADKAKQLMINKNHDYGEAWRSMRISSYTDLILMKILRTKQIENNKGVAISSEGIDANYYDMINYAIFGLIKLTLE
ncbi:MAG: DUF1599 domain-containing protein [Bacteroidales bacterium]